MTDQLRHPITGRYMAGDCERDCLEHCAGLCGVGPRTRREGDVMIGSVIAGALVGIAGFLAGVWVSRDRG